MNKIHIFKAGKQRAASGIEYDFGVESLKGMVASYDAAVHEAPAVVGHPKSDDPAFGWVKACFLEGENLYADFGQLNPQFVEAVGDGRYKKRSMAVYLPGSPSHPIKAGEPGADQLYLRHVGFLGAQPPAVKGLKAAEFAEEEEGVVIFEEVTDMEVGWTFKDIGRAFRSIKNYIIETAGLEKAEEVLSDWPIDSIRDTGTKIVENAIDNTSSFKEGTPVEGQMDPKDVKALKEGQEQLDKDKIEFAENQRKLKVRVDALDAKEGKANRDACAEFVEGLVKEGKVLPAMQAGLVGLMCGDTEAVCFAEAADATDPASARTFLERFLASYPKQIEFAELGGGGVDPKKLSKNPTEAAKQLAGRAKKIAKESDVTFEEALTQAAKEMGN